MSALDSTVVGVGCVNPAEVMRDPVTTTASRDSFDESSWLPCLGTSAAAARGGATDRTNKDAQQTHKSRLTVGIFSLNPMRPTARWRLFGKRMQHKRAFTKPSIKKHHF
jgi:hypothetical protein